MPTTELEVHYLPHVKNERAACGVDTFARRYTVWPLQTTCENCAEHPDVKRAHTKESEDARRAAAFAATLDERARALSVRRLKRA